MDGAKDGVKMSTYDLRNNYAALSICILLPVNRDDAFDYMYASTQKRIRIANNKEAYDTIRFLKRCGMNITSIERMFNLGRGNLNRLVLRHDRK
jgi:hypothetical protein